jgi:hypothetical protein
MELTVLLSKIFINVSATCKGVQPISFKLLSYLSKKYTYKTTAADFVASDDLN